MKKTQKLQQFWKHNINPITGYRIKQVEDEYRFRKDKHKRNDLMREELISPNIQVD